ncbi:MAG: hypothetical protein R2838_07110 [Caldilineaceae bacterium]
MPTANETVPQFRERPAQNPWRYHAAGLAVVERTRIGRRADQQVLDLRLGQRNADEQSRQIGAENHRAWIDSIHDKTTPASSSRRKYHGGNSSSLPLAETIGPFPPGFTRVLPARLPAGVRAQPNRDGKVGAVYRHPHSSSIDI